MMKKICSYMFGTHEACEKDLHATKSESILYINQIQELKAINNYQAFEFEQKIKELELELARYAACQNKMEENSE
jgi:hypothetical protein